MSRYRKRPPRWQGGPLIQVVHWLLILPIGLLFTMLMGTLAGFIVLAVERGEAVVIDRALLSLFVREAVALSLFWLLRPLGIVNSAPVGVPVDEGAHYPPVLLIPGSSINRGALSFLRAFLTHRGTSWVWSINTQQHKTGIVQAAQDLDASIQRLCRESQQDQIDLVGYGSGGLVAAWYVRHLDKKGRIRRLVTIGTPWKGTKMSVFRKGRLGDDLLHGTHLLDDLVSKVPTVSIWSSHDPTVIPSTSACPDNVQSVEIDGAGHADMLISARVFRAVKAALS